MRYIAARREAKVMIRLQAVYSAVAMGGIIAIMTVLPVFCINIWAAAWSGLWRWWRTRYLASAQSGLRHDSDLADLLLLVLWGWVITWMWR